ncbi:alpha/beta hydrolase [Ancylomarina longa]|uniref:Alpha/beta fold hydrolase n=1 Tax=Ancylomarina longa TaxID=2487017 RepID=A0A434AG15_9BACT|nr:alpha/beta hydrolase [Ancylomarina longa]RUT73320.1 alpha/beta fold hydrolase [Ancylomarina longa]
MQHQILHFNFTEHSNLFAQIWQPDEKPKAVICLVHGIGEHSSRYWAWAERFVNANFAVLGFDQRGHGLSSGKRGVISSYQDLMNDIDFVLEEIAARFKDVQVFLYGHSMGGGEVLNHLLTRKSNYLAVISTSPWIITQAAPPKFIIPLIRLINRIVPTVSVTTKFDSSMLSYDEQVVRNYEEDDLVHHKVSFALFTGAYDAGYKILHCADKLKKPLLLLHGSDDQITSPAASKSFAEMHKENCTFRLWNGAFHELHNELIKNQVFEFVLDWMNHILEKN